MTGAANAPALAGFQLEPLLATLERNLGEGLLGVVMYGSHARGEAQSDSDVDLLVIARGLPERRYARGQWFTQVKFESGYTGPTLSMLGKSPEEFEGHFPALYLDIGQDGLVLFDRDGYTARRLARIRELIAEAGLASRRIDGERLWEITRPTPAPPGYWGIEWDGYHEYAG